MKTRLKSFFVMFVLLITLFTACEKSEIPVARIGHLTVSQNELRNYLKSKFKNTPIAKITPQQKAKALEEIIQYDLKYLYCREKGITDNPILKTKAEIRFESYLHKKITNEFIDENYFSGTRKIKLYDDYVNRAVYRKITLYHQNSLIKKSDRSEKTAWKMADSLKSILDKNSNRFSYFVMKYSDSPDADKGGFVKNISRLQLNSEMANAVFNSPLNKVVGPVKSKEGINIIVVVKRYVEEKVPPFEKFDVAVKPDILKIKKGEIRNLILTEGKKLADNFNLQLNEDAVSTFSDEVKKWSERSPLILDSLFNKVKDLQLVTYDNYSLTGGKLIYSVHKFNKNYRNFIGKKALTDFLNKRSSFNGWLLTALQKRMDTTPESTEQYENIIADLAVFHLNTKLRTEIKIPEKKLKDYFANNRDKFKIPDKMRTYAIYTQDKKEADELYQKVMRNKSVKYFQKLSYTYSKDKKNASLKGDLGYIYRSSKSDLASIVFKNGPHKIITPQKIKNYFVIIKTGNLIKGRDKTYEESRYAIQRILLSKKITEKENELLQQLRQKYSIKIYDKNLEELI